VTPLKRFVVAAATSAVIILLLTLGTYALHLWIVGSLSIRDVTLQNLVMFPVVVGLVAALWPSRRLFGHPVVAASAGVVIGLAYSYFARRLVLSYHFGLQEIFGPIIWQFDLPMLVCAAVAGTCAMLLSVPTPKRSVVMTVGVVLAIAFIIPGPTFDLIIHNEGLTVLILTPQTNEARNEPDVDSNVYSRPVDVVGVTNRVHALLEDKGIEGQYQVSGICRSGRGKEALVVIVLNQPVASKVELQEPDGGVVIYLQRPGRWERIPPQSPTLRGVITLGPPPSEEGMADMGIMFPNGWATHQEILRTTE
jgi:hypothetical protein